MDEPNGLGAVLRTGESELITEVSDAMLVRALEDKPEILEIARDLGLASAISVARVSAWSVGIGRRGFG